MPFPGRSIRTGDVACVHLLPWGNTRSHGDGRTKPLAEVQVGETIYEFCFARPTHTYLDLNAGRDFEREIVVKVNVPEVLRAELARPSWKREHVALGTNTDPYQWVESRYKLMPGIWQALLDSDTPGSLVTKSPLALRDIEHPRGAGRRGPGCPAFMSVPTLDERAWRETEPHTPSPTRAHRGGAQAERGRRAGGHPDRAADARHQRRARAGGGDRAARGRRRRDQRGDRWRCTCAARCKDIFFDWLRAAPARPDPALRGALREAAPTRRSEERKRLAGARRRCPAGAAPASRRAPARADRGAGARRRARPAEPKQRSLF